MTLVEKRIDLRIFERSMKAKNVVLLGPPGGGKGTQAELARDQLGFVHYSTGNVFREHIERRTKLGLGVDEFVRSGRLVPDEVVLEVVKAFLGEHSGRSILFDGFPRTVPQAQGLDLVLENQGRQVDQAVLIDLSDDEVVRRLSARRQCRSCGKIYNLDFGPPKGEGVCDDCGGELYQRDDDREATIRDRLRTYHEQTEPLVSYYESQGKLTRIDGSIGKRRVFDELRRRFDAAEAPAGSAAAHG